jgi:hypothetical protein
LSNYFRKIQTTNPGKKQGTGCKAEEMGRVDFGAFVVITLLLVDIRRNRNREIVECEWIKKQSNLERLCIFFSFAHWFSFTRKFSNSDVQM